MTHTPGPWTQDPNDSDMIFGPHGESVATVTAVLRDDVTGRPVWTTVDDANARLIAAAPEMLDLVARCGNWEWLDDDTKRTMIFHEARAMLRAVES